MGVRRGIRPHTPWEEVLEIVEEVRGRGVEVIVTLGAGSLTDGAKVVAFVSFCSFTLWFFFGLDGGEELVR